MRVLLYARCLSEPCIICTTPVHTCDLGECPEGFGAPWTGRRLPSGAWVCSALCEKSATSWPRARDRWTVPTRILAGVGLTLAATSFMVPAAGLQLGLALSGLLSCSMCALLAALEKRPEARGRVKGGR